MQHLETCLLIAEANRVLCPLMMFFNYLFPLDVQNEIQLLSRVLSYSWLVVYWVFGSEIRRLSKLIIRFRMALFCFSPCWMRTRIIKAQAILALLDSFQELHLEIW